MFTNKKKKDDEKYEIEWTQKPELKYVISQTKYVIWHRAIEEINKKTHGYPSSRKANI